MKPSKIEKINSILNNPSDGPKFDSVKNNLLDIEISFLVININRNCYKTINRETLDLISVEDLIKILEILDGSFISAGEIVRLAIIYKLRNPNDPNYIINLNY